MTIEYPLSLNVEFPIHIKVNTELFMITPELYKKIPKDSTLFNIINPQSPFQSNKDNKGNVVLMQDLKPRMFKLMLEYLETGNATDLLINSVLDRPELVSTFDYFCIPIPHEFQHEQSINQALLKGAQIRERNNRVYEDLVDQAFHSVVKEFLPTASKISRILISDMNRYFALERKATNEKYSSNNVSFSLHYTCDKVHVKLEYKGIQVEFKDQFECIVNDNTLAGLAFTFLSVLWGLGYSKDELRSLCFGKMNELQLYFRARFLE
ncbi:hypothetical protein HDV06_002815 [Boothiomyces sp. JEL0866]|nr:hypothetical protein HDV06_002815 [Boothiomyces sp. JEL0866]